MNRKRLYDLLHHPHAHRVEHVAHCVYLVLFIIEGTNPVRVAAGGMLLVFAVAHALAP
jgi:hypothetical protein